MSSSETELPNSTQPSPTNSDLLRELATLKSELHRRTRGTKLFRYQPYAKQREFHAAGLVHRERLLMAANQVGKTLAGACEAAFHLTTISRQFHIRTWKSPWHFLQAGPSSQRIRRRLDQARSQTQLGWCAWLAVMALQSRCHSRELRRARTKQVRPLVCARHPHCLRPNGCRRGRCGRRPSPVVAELAGTPSAEPAARLLPLRKALEHR